MDILEFGQRVQIRRKQMKVSQEWLASVNGMSRATISNLENGKLSEIGLRKAMAICAVLDLEFDLKDKSKRPTLRDLIKENQRHA